MLIDQVIKSVLIDQVIREKPAGSGSGRAAARQVSSKYFTYLQNVLAALIRATGQSVMSTRASFAGFPPAVQVARVSQAGTATAGRTPRPRAMPCTPSHTAPPTRVLKHRTRRPVLSPRPPTRSPRPRALSYRCTPRRRPDVSLRHPGSTFGPWPPWPPWPPPRANL